MRLSYITQVNHPLDIERRNSVLLFKVTESVMSTDIANIHNRMMRVFPQHQGNIAHC
jgi:hypothetical protein